VALAVAGGILRPHSPSGAAIEWFGMSIGRARFVALSSVAFAAWAVLAVNREMDRELKVRALPWAYPAFALFLGAYLTGFVEESGRSPQVFVMVAFLVALALGYYGLFADVTTAMSLRRLEMRARARDWRRALEALPMWAAALALAAVLGLLASAWPPPADATRPGLGAWMGLFPIVLILAAARDAGLLVFFALAPRPGRVEGAALLYIVLLWWIVPGLLDAAGLPTAAQALRPVGLEHWQAALAMAVQVAIVWSGAAWRWRARQRALGVRPMEAGARGV